MTSMRDARLWAALLAQERWWVPPCGWREYMACGSIAEVETRRELEEMTLDERFEVCRLLIRNASYLAWAAGHGAAERGSPLERWEELAAEPFVRRVVALNAADGIEGRVWPARVQAWFAELPRDSGWRRVKAWADAGGYEGLAAELVPYASEIVRRGRPDAVAVLLAAGVLGSDADAVLCAIENPGVVR